MKLTVEFTTSIVILVGGCPGMSEKVLTVILAGTPLLSFKYGIIVNSYSVNGFKDLTM